MYIQLTALFIFSICLVACFRKLWQKVICAIPLTMFYCLELVSYFTTNELFNYSVYSHISFDVVMQTFDYYSLWWLALAVIFIGLAIVFIMIPNARPIRSFCQGRKKLLAICAASFFVLLMPNGVVAGIVAVGKIIYEFRNNADIKTAFASLGLNPADYITHNSLIASSNSPKNIIVISLESFDRRWLQQERVTPRLNNLSENWRYFSNFDQLPGTSPTISSLYACLTGVPAIFSSTSNEYFADKQTNASIVSLPTVLKKAGYTLCYLSSAPLFAGTDVMLKSLGFDEIFGGNISDYPPNTQKSPAWGYYDKDIFALAQSKYLELKQQGNPFFLGISTIDTHAPYPPKHFDKRGQTELDLDGLRAEHVFSWVDHLVGEFIDFIAAEGGLDDTAVYIMPDHYMPQSVVPNSSMVNNFDAGARSLYLLTNAPETDLRLAVDTPISHFDLPRIILNGASISTNAIFLKDLFLKASGNQDFAEWITANNPKFVNFNHALWLPTESPRNVSIMLANGDLTVMDSNELTQYQRMAKIAPGEAALIRFSSFTSEVSGEPRIDVVPIAALNHPWRKIVTNTLVVVPTNDGLFGTFGYSDFVKQTYFDAENLLSIDIRDVRSLDKQNKLLTGNAAKGETRNNANELVLQSVNLNGRVAYGNSFIRCADQSINLKRGVSLFVFTNDIVLYQTFDTYSSKVDAQSFIKALSAARTSNLPMGLVVHDSANRHLAALSHQISTLGFPKLATLGFRRPYIAYTTASGKIVELAPSESDVVNKQLNFDDNEISGIYSIDFIRFNTINEYQEKAGNPFWRKGGEDDFHHDPSAFIAHGGGAIEGKICTNSLEAVNLSIKNGFKFIELDLGETTEGELFGARGIPTFNNITGFREKGDAKPSLDEIKGRLIYNKFTPLTSSDIREIFTNNQDLILVTDKIRNLDKVIDDFPLSERLVTEVFSLDDYIMALMKGVRYPLYNATNSQLLTEAILYNVNKITVSASLLISRRAELMKLHDRGVAIFAYGHHSDENTPQADTEEFFAEFFGNSISGYYTDFWSPKLGSRVTDAK